MEIKGKYIIVYYTVLLLLMMSWTSYDSFPPTILRIVYLAAVLAPGLLDKDCTIPAALTCFWGIAVNGYAYSYMLTMVYLYIGILILLTFVIHRYKKRSMLFRGYMLPIVMCLFVTLRNLVASSSIEDITWSLLLFLIFPLFIADTDTFNEKRMSWAFMTLTAVLSYYCFTTQELFAGAYGGGPGNSAIATRSGWTDPNYLSMIVGMGAVIGFRNILRLRRVDKLTAVLALVSFGMAVPAMMLLVSRGGLLCLCGSVSMLLLFSKVKTGYKIGILSLIIVFVVILYTNDFLVMLEERLNGEAGGSNNERMWILERRLTAFADGSPIYWIIGYGLQDGLLLGLPYVMGNHNDYVAFLTEYGVVGLFMFIGILLLPVYNMKYGSKVYGDVVAYTFYLMLASLTLEPFAFGRWIHYIFLLFIIIVVRNDYASRKKNMIKKDIAPLIEEKEDINIIDK